MKKERSCREMALQCVGRTRRSDFETAVDGNLVPIRQMDRVFPVLY